MSFTVEGPDPDPERLRLPTAAPDASVTFDDDASPWYTIADVEAADRPRLLHDLTATFAAAGVSIRSARAETRNGPVHIASSSPTAGGKADRNHPGSSADGAPDPIPGPDAPAQQQGGEESWRPLDTSAPRHEHAREA
ncbi:MAG: hypothetical protein M3P34_02300 [Actinomycetota bacterium]|nr:hypothetical protein [Actinomycetota bacterium]